MSLQNLFLEKDAHDLDASYLDASYLDASDLDASSKQNLQRHLLKFAKATQSSLTKSALQQNHIQLLTAINNEAKPRRSTRALILEKGSGQIFFYEHPKLKRLKRAEEDAAKKLRSREKNGRRSKDATQESATQEAVEATTTVMARRGRKRKSTASDTETDSPAARDGPSAPKNKVARVSYIRAAEALDAPWMTPVAKVY
jgi:hypothetical protein